MTYQNVALVAVVAHFLTALGLGSWGSVVAGVLLAAAYWLAYRREEAEATAATIARARRAKGQR